MAKRDLPPQDLTSVEEQQEKRLNRLFADSGLPASYEGFVRNVRDLSYGERRQQTEDMVSFMKNENPEDFADGTLEQKIKRFFSAYDKEFPRREMSAEIAEPQKTRPAAESAPVQESREVAPETPETPTNVIAPAETDAESASPAKEAESATSKLAVEDMAALKEIFAKFGVPEKYWDLTRELIEAPAEIREAKLEELKGKKKVRRAIESSLTYLAEGSAILRRNEAAAIEQDSRLDHAGDTMPPEHAADEAPVAEAAPDLSSEQEAQPAREPAPEKKEDIWYEKSREWDKHFRSAIVSGTAKEWIGSPDGPGAEKFFEAADNFVTHLLQDKDLLPLLVTKYELYVHRGGTFATENMINVSVRDLMEKNPEALAKSLIRQIRKQEEMPIEPEEEPAREIEIGPHPAERASGPEAREKRAYIRPGDLVIWETNGTLRFKQPIRVIRIDKDPRSKRTFAFFEEFPTGIPVDELVKQEQPGEIAAAAAESQPEQRTAEGTLEREPAGEENGEDPEQRLSRTRDAYVALYRAYTENNSRRNVTMPDEDDDFWTMKSARVEYETALKAAVEAKRQILLQEMQAVQEEMAGEGREIDQDVADQAAHRELQEFVTAEEEKLAGLLGRVELPPAEELPESQRPETDLDRGSPRLARAEEDESFTAWSRRRIAETASRVAERFGVKNLVDSARIAWSSELADWHLDRAVYSRIEVSAASGLAKDLEAGRKYLERQIEAFRAQGEISPAALARMEKEHMRVGKDVEKAKNMADSWQSKLEHRNNQRGRFENRRDEICRGYMGRVAEKLDPFEEKLSDLKLTRDQLSGEIAHYRISFDAQWARINELRRAAERERFPSVRKAYRETVRQCESVMKDIVREVDAREKDRGKIDTRIMKQDRKANQLRDKKNQLARITQRQGPDTSVPAKYMEAASYNDRAVSGHPFAGDVVRLNADAGDRGGDRVRRDVAIDRHPEFRKTYTGDRLVAAWNALEGSHMLIDPKFAKKRFPGFFRESQSVDDLSRFAEFYAEVHGDRDQLEGMPNMRTAARKQRGFWARLFGSAGRRRNQRHLLDFLGRNR